METGANNISLKVNFSSSLNNILTEKYHLSIEVSLDHFAFTILDTLTYTYKLLKVFEINAKGIKNRCKKILDIINTEKILQKEFYSSSLALNNFPSTLIPIPFYKEEQKKQVLSFNHEIYEEILTDKIQNIDAFNIYSIPKDLQNIIHSSFPNTQIKCFSSILIDQLLVQNKENEEKVIYASINRRNLEVCVIGNNQLEFYNRFETDSKEDILYFLLFTYEQLELSPDKIELILLDDILESDEQYNLLYQYIRNISFGKRPENLQYSQDINSIKPHQYFCLFSQVLCA